MVWSKVKTGSAKQVMMHCNNGWNTRLHRYDFLKILKRTKFFGLAEAPVASTYCWSAQCSWFCLFLFPPLDVVCSVEQPHRLPKSPCMQLRIGGRQVVTIATIGGLRLHPGFQCKHPQSRGCLHRGPTRPTVCFPCYRQRTTTHHTGWLASPFFGCHLDLAWHPSIFLIDVGL